MVIIVGMTGQWAVVATYQYFRGRDKTSLDRSFGFSVGRGQTITRYLSTPVRRRLP
jgi:hypothetical protein